MFDPAKGYPSIVPYQLYRDPNAAVHWLCEVFGFTEAVRFTTGDGTIGHAELVRGGFVVSVGYAPQPMPAEHGQITSMVLIFVDSVDEICAHAVAAGGTIISAAKDQPWGLRQAVVADPPATNGKSASTNAMWPLKNGGLRSSLRYPADTPRATSARINGLRKRRAFTDHRGDHNHRF